MKKLVAVLLCVLMVMGMMTGCNKSEKTDWEYIKAKGEIIVGYDNKFPPMGFVDLASGKDIGFDLDLAAAVFAEMGIKVKLQPINWKTKEAELESKSIDCIWNGYTINEKRKAMVNFSNPYLKNEQVIVMRVADKDKYTKLAEFKGATMLVQDGSTAIGVVEKTAELKDNKLTKIEDNVQIMNEVLLSAADIAVMDYVVANYILSQDNSFKGKLMVAPNISLDYEEYGIGFRKNDVETTNKVNDAMKKMKDNGKLAEIAEKWGLTDLLLIK